MNQEKMYIFSILGLALFALLTVWLFRFFTPEPPPFVVEYVSPKLDPIELRFS